MDIDSNLVKRLIGSQFPEWADLPIKPVEFDGWDNRTFHLGEDMSVRLPSAKWYAGQVEKEQRWLPKLAPLLPVLIPVPLAMGVPEISFPWHWSVYRWLDGDNAAAGTISDLNLFATSLAQFLTALEQIDTTGGPPAGPHNFFRGGPLATYDSETLDSITALGDRIDARATKAVWQSALKATWQGPAVWLHGDVAASNLLVKNGHLNAVIDFGCSLSGPAGP